MGIYTEIRGVLKIRLNEVFIKNKTFLIREGIWIKGRVKLINELEKGRDGSGSAWDVFFIKGYGSGKWIKVWMKLYDKITKLFIISFERGPYP